MNDGGSELMFYSHILALPFFLLLHEVRYEILVRLSLPFSFMQCVIIFSSYSIYQTSYQKSYLEHRTFTESVSE